MHDIASALFGLAPHLRSTAKHGHNFVMIQCPFHGGGQEKTPSCSVNREIPVFFCHGCHTSGHVSQLLRSFGLSRDAVQVVLKSVGMDKRTAAKRGGKGKLAARLVSGGYNPFRGKYILDEDLLDAYRHAPKQLLRAGFTKSTLRHFEVGYDAQNMRITFPIRNIYGDLVGVSGRAVIPDDEPRYKIYKEELKFRNGFYVPEEYTMDEVKEAVLWHGHVISPFFYHEQDEYLVITEGFKACMWTWQSGYKTTAALIGSYLSALHAELISTAVKYVVLFLDNNNAGLLGTVQAGWKLAEKGLHVRIANYPDEREQPDNLDPVELRKAIRQSILFYEWRSENERRIHEATRVHGQKAHERAS